MAVKKTKTGNILDTLHDFGRVPPQDITAEQAVLAAIIVAPDTIDDVAIILIPQMFYRDSHQKIYQAIVDLYTSGTPPDIYTVTSRLKDNGQLDEIGGPVYLVDISKTVVTGRYVVSHAEIIKEKYLRREYIRISHELQALSFDESFSFRQVAQQAEQSFFDISRHTVPTFPESAKTIFAETAKYIEMVSSSDKELVGVPSGMTKLDRITLGWQKTDLILIAARPSMGKTAFSLFCSRNAAEMGYKVMFFSLEMSKQQLSFRLLADEYNSVKQLKTGNDITWPRLENSMGKEYVDNLIIDDTPGLSVMEMRSTVRREIRERDVQLVVVDYLQLAEGDQDFKNNGDRYIGSISSALKNMAKELNIPVIALSQLNRSVDSRPNPLPVLSDLRESGRLEQDADMVIFLTRFIKLAEKHHWDGQNNDLRGKGYVDIAKNRNGPTERLMVNVTIDAMNWGFEDEDEVQELFDFIEPSRNDD